MPGSARPVPEPGRIQTIKQGGFSTECWAVLKETIENWSAHKCSTFGAALAYYSIFSFGPLMLIGTVIAGLALGPDAARNEITGQASSLLGGSGGHVLDALLAGADRPHQSVLTAILGVGTLLFAAVSVVVQLKTALSTVWEVEPSPHSGWWDLARSYLVSLAGVLALGFLLLVSLMFTAALSAAGKLFVTYMPEQTLQLAGSGASFVLITVLFAMMFKWLPDAPVDWRDVWLGAVLTALLFEAGKFIIGSYVGKLSLQSTYGAATSLVMLLIWVYYSSQIVLFGAEFTHVYARRHDRCGNKAGDRAAPSQDQGGAIPRPRRSAAPR
jgi:membrane protein